jgi:hypothetical protein
MNLGIGSLRSFVSNVAGRVSGNDTITSGRLVSSKSSSIGGPVMLLGYDKVRYDYLRFLKESASSNSYFFIDWLNDALSLSKRIDIDFIGLSEELKSQEPLSADFSAHKEKAIKKMCRIAGITADLARALLDSWSDYLALHSESLSISSILKFSSIRGQDQATTEKTIFSFINKNFDDKVVPDSDISLMKDSIWYLSTLDDKGLREDLPGVLEAHDDLLDILTNAFFRRTSKLAMEWAKIEGIPVRFVGGKSVRKQLVDQKSESGNPNSPYKVGFRTPSYSPITHSEMRKNNRMGNFVPDVKVPKR